MHARRLSPLEPGIEQLARLPFARGGAAMGEDEIERVTRTNVAIEVHILAQRLEIGLDRTGRCARGTRRAIEAVTDGAADAQRRFIDPDHILCQRKIGAFCEPPDLEFEIEARAKTDRLERARRARCGAATEGNVERCTRFDFAQRQRRADQFGHALAVVTPHAGAAQHAFEAIASCQRRDHFEPRPFRRGGERFDQRGRTHVPATVGPERERENHLAAVFIAHRIVDMRGCRCLERGETRPEGQGSGSQADECAQPAQPTLAADFAAEIGRKVECGDPARKLFPQGGPGKRGSGWIRHDLVMRQGRRGLSVTASRRGLCRILCVRVGRIHAVSLPIGRSGANGCGSTLVSGPLPALPAKTK